MKYKAILFDLDGVICNTDQFHYWAWQQIADEIGVHFDENINNRLRGVSRKESLDIILESHSPKLNEAEKEYYLNKKNDLYRGLLKQMSPADLSAEVKETMDRLKSQGILLAIGSSSKNARPILKQLGLENYFHAVSDGTNISRSKPDPEVFLKASEYLAIAPEFCLVVEDAKSGIEAALAAKMDCAAYGNGTSYNLAHYNLEKITDLLPIVLSRN
ncbi:MAG: beta-phosphoglucomutase [Syntrophomonadaceae bacterium]|jgi:beta-phosphoglucomutase|nr:beta-phosphoglucomutase [Syntrophomonadaceae bacterium]